MEQQMEFCQTLLDNLYDGVYFVDSARKITYWSRGAERITGYPADRVMGMCCSDNILVHVDERGTQLCTDECPLSHTIGDGEMHTADVFLHHRNGQRVPVGVAVSPIRDSSGVIIGAVEIFREKASEGIDPVVFEEMKHAALLDPLTGLANRRFLDMKLTSNIEEMRRHDIPFGVIFADIDHFKSVNDTYGHSTGDAVLKMVGKTLEGNVRKSDLAGRWGGEEFVLVVSFISGEELRILAEKLRMLVENSFIETEKGRLGVTVTMGGTIARKGDTTETILERADRLLYEGKTAGRNRVIF